MRRTTIFALMGLWASVFTGCEAAERVANAAMAKRPAPEVAATAHTGSLAMSFDASDAPESVSCRDGCPG